MLYAKTSQRSSVKQHKLKVEKNLLSKHFNLVLLVNFFRTLLVFKIVFLEYEQFLVTWILSKAIH